MLHPGQFDVNEAWIAFRLNRAPIKTEIDGDLHCIAMMDAASCFLLGMEMISASADLTRDQCNRLFSEAWSHKRELPSTLFIPEEDNGTAITMEAEQRGIDVVRVPDSSLVGIIGEAREGFSQRFEDGPA